jgi:stearoyl-CoA desaturase (delta-9 desaturase)
MELGLMLGLYVITCMGTTLGYHRMFTHRAFQSSKAFRTIIAVLGSMAVEGSVITWVADHRKHHAFTDVEGDPHSPHLAGPGFWGGLKGLWHAHIGWLFETVGQADRERFAPDMVNDRALRIVDKTFLLWVILSFAIPFGLGWLIGGGIGSALSALLWGGLVRVFFLHHVTWSVNSICHFFGRRRFEVADESRNVFWLAPLSMGEGWHHNHHAFPTSAFHGLRFWERMTDPTGLMILLLEKLGVIWNVVRISPERQAAKLVSAASVGAQAAAAGAQAARASAQTARASAQAAVGSAQAAAAVRAQAAAAGVQAASSGAIVRPAPARLSQ